MSAVAAAPANISVTPSSGSGTSQTFALLYSDPDGATDIVSTAVLINATLDSRNACYVLYNRSANWMYLFSDDGQTTLGPVIPGSSNSVQNSQCTLAGTGSSVSASGTNLTVSVALSFKPTFTGEKGVYMTAQDQSGASAAFTRMGFWRTGQRINHTPTSVSVTPSSGAGTTQAFTLVYSDPDGFADIARVHVLFNGTPDLRSSCGVSYSRNGIDGSLSLTMDDGRGSSGHAIPGSGETLENSQCTLDSTESSVSVSGNTLTLTIFLTFSPTFTGTKNIYMWVQDVDAALNSGSPAFELKGTWSPSTSPNRAPVPVSATPSSGSGGSQTFSFQYSDLDGVSDLRVLYALINGPVDSRSACYIIYYPAPNSMYLVSDDGQSAVGPIYPDGPGPVVDIENSQCRLSFRGTSVVRGGANFTLNVLTTFKTGFQGLKNIYMAVQDMSGVSVPFAAKGTWTPNASANPGPRTISVTPSSGTGSATTFTLTYADLDGYTQLHKVGLLINSAADSRNSCYAIYYPASKYIFLVNDTGSGVMGPAVIGTASNLQNSQCTINAAGTSASGSGTNLVLQLSVSFKPGFTGTKNLFMLAQSNLGATTSGFDNRGTWTVVP